MNRFVLFLKKIYVPLIFIILEVTAINFYADSTLYTRAKILTASNKVVGWLHGGISGVGDYFGLRRENRMLADRLAEQHNELEQYKAENPQLQEHPQAEGAIAKYTYMWASVENNTTSRYENYILLDKGTDDGVRSNMALVTPDGSIAGYIVDCNDKYSVGISILNTSFKTVGKLKTKGNVGSVSWDGSDPMELTLSELDKYAEIAVGDTVLTGNSLIFPSDMMIGIVSEFEMTKENNYRAKVTIPVNMHRLHKLLIVDYSDLYHRGSLEEQYFDTGVNIEE